MSGEQHTCVGCFANGEILMCKLGIDAVAQCLKFLGWWERTGGKCLPYENDLLGFQRYPRPKRIKKTTTGINVAVFFNPGITSTGIVKITDDLVIDF